MTQGTLDRKSFEAIEAYVLGTMPGDERIRFEEVLATDAALRAEMELQRDNIRAVELGGMSRMLRSIAADEAAVGAKSGGWKAYLKYAAVIALLFTTALWWLSREPVHERLFAEHFVADPGLPVTMGANNAHAFNDAMVAYKLGDYMEASGKWSALLQQDPTNDTLRFYLASALLASGDADQAIPLFKGASERAGSAFSDRTRWYLFLAYLRAGRVAEAKALGLETDPVHGARVRAIISELN